MGLPLSRILISLDIPAGQGAVVKMALMKTFDGTLGTSAVHFQGRGIWLLLKSERARTGDGNFLYFHTDAISPREAEAKQLLTD
jgi:hypothetical protein